MPLVARLCKVLCCIACIGCSSSLPVRVLPEGETRAIASVGGPIAPSTMPTVITPYLTVGAMHGVADLVTVHANVHVPLATFTVVGLDAGASMRVIKADSALPELTLGARMMMFTDLKSWTNARLYPDFHANISWELSERTLLYGGTHLTFQYTPYVAFVSPFLGIEFPISKKTSLQIELMWQAANVNTQKGVFEGESSIGGNGSIGGFIGASIQL